MPHADSVEPAARLGFTLIEVIVAVAILAILAAVVTPNILGQLERERIEAAEESLSGLGDAISRFHADVGRYPGALSHLAEPITTAQTNSCGATYSGGDRNKWKGPYLNRLVSTGVPVAIGTASNALQRQATQGNNGLLSIVIPGVMVQDAELLNTEVDADGNATAGTIQWTLPADAYGQVTVSYVMPVSGC